MGLKPRKRPTEPLKVAPSDIAEAEQRLGVSFPDSYKGFLLASGVGPVTTGDYGGACVKYFYHPAPAAERNVSVYWNARVLRDELPAGVIPVAQCAFSNQICVAMQGENRGRVYKYIHDAPPPAIDYEKRYPWFQWAEGEPSKPDDWPGHPDLTLIAEDFAEFLTSFQDDSQ